MAGARKAAGQRARKPSRWQGVKGTERPRAWLYAVINPCVDILKFEASFVEAGHFSFRHHNRQLEHLKPLREQLAPGAELVLDDLGRREPAARAWERRHDDGIARLREAAESAWTQLHASPRLDEDVRQFLQSTPAEQPRDREFSEFAATRWEAARDLVAERIVNNADSPGFGTTDAAFWDRHRERLLQLRAGPEFERLDALGAAFVKDTREVATALEELRWEVVDRFGISPAPVESVLGTVDDVA